MICESVFNALTCVVYGHPAVALLGTGSSSQIDQLKKLGVSSFVICLDNDDAGKTATENLVKELSKFKETKFVVKNILANVSMLNYTEGVKD